MGHWYFPKENKQKDVFMSLNKVLLIGRLGKEPEIRHTPSGSIVAKFTLATNEVFNDKAGQKKELTEWHNIEVWGKAAEHCNTYLNKGSKCYVEGRIKTQSWDDKDGNKKYMTVINALNVQFLDPVQKNTQTQEQSQEYKPSVQESFKSDEIPF